MLNASIDASMKGNPMKTAMQLKADVMAELAWDPAINAANIGVMVKDGVVTLAGHIDTYAEKHAVERAVRRVSGVRAIALDLDVKLSTDHERTDSEIAQAALTALRWHALVPEELVKVEVEDGWVTLRGQVDSRFQLTNAEQGIRSLVGVRGLTNKITIKPHARQNDISAEITGALTRQAQREASHIKVDVDGAVVTLTGTVHSLLEHDAAVGSAWATRGVGRVLDRLEVRP
jgi:osmotically-inducible protein OsmY